MVHATQSGTADLLHGKRIASDKRSGQFESSLATPIRQYMKLDVSNTASLTGAANGMFVSGGPSKERLVDVGIG
jgi:hypothetical protein